MKVIAIICVFETLVGLNYAQRGSYAGSRPIVNGIKGPFPEENNELASRFSDNSPQQNVISLPQNFPIYVPHNMYHIDQVNQRPVHDQPFWFANRDYINEALNGPQGFSQNSLQGGPQVGSQNGPQGISQKRLQNGQQGGFQNQPQVGFQNQPQGSSQGRPQIISQNGFQNRPQVGSQSSLQNSSQGQPQLSSQNGLQNSPQVGSQNAPQGGSQVDSQFSRPSIGGSVTAHRGSYMGRR